MCEQQYFIEYVLGLRGPSNKKADKGTIVHKVLELLAIIKQSQQDSIPSFDDEVVGLVNVSKYNLDTLIQKTYKYYTDRFSHHTWEPKDYKDCHAWTYKAIQYHEGAFDPRNREIVCPEQHFDIVINKPWAAYSYDTDEGKLDGNLALKGTIDLITKVNDNTLEIVDWKTGRRLDWATGKEKTPEKLQSDPQLMIYHYAISQLYPQYDHVIVTIYFINDGGPFSILFDKTDLARTEQMLQKKFEIIKQTRQPRLNKTWMCSKLCHFGKTTFQDSTKVLPIIEYRDHQTCNKDSFMTKCEQIKHDVEIKGMKSVVSEYKADNHSFGKYKAPGSAE
jgi:ATP-dependent helicase/DNAse subunit B